MRLLSKLVFAALIVVLTSFSLEECVLRPARAHHALEKIKRGSITEPELRAIFGREAIWQLPDGHYVPSVPATALLDD